MIYVIQAVGTDWVKVGIATSPKKRLAWLQTAIPLELVMLAVADWPDEDERVIHGLLWEHRIRGEWFKHCKTVDEIVERMKSGAKSYTEEFKEHNAPTARLARVLELAKLGK